ncbi:MAG: outer membrane protein transport protein [Bacteroidota bacterium]
MKKRLLAASLVLSAFSSFGSGYQLNLQGLRQLAMGGTGTAWTWDAATIFYNPAGLCRLNGIQVYASTTLLMPSTAFSNQVNSGTETTAIRSERQNFLPFNIYVGGPIQQDSRFALGLGIYTPFGSGLKWDNNWLGKYLVQSVNMKSVFFQPTISYRISDRLSVGAGFVYAAGSFDYTAALPVHGVNGPGQDDGTVMLDGSASGVGFNAGIQFRANEDLQFGLSYRSQVNMDIGRGNANFTVPASLKDSFPDTQFDTQLPCPGVLSLGTGWRFNDLTLQFDLNYTMWNAFDSLRFNFVQHTGSLQDMHAPRHYRNTLTARIGACYKISRVVAIMGGAAFDPTPVVNGFVSPDLPDADRYILTAGIAIKPLPGFTILAALEGVSTERRAASYNYGGLSGVYQTQAINPGIGIYYNF